MDTAFNYLLKIINDEVKNCEDILEFLFEKEKCIISNNVLKLKDLSFKEHALFVKARELEVSRFSILEVVGRKIGLNIKKTNMLTLAEKLLDPFKSEIVKMRGKLSELLSKIKQQNQKCEILLKKSIEIVNFSISVFTGKAFNKSRQMYTKNYQSEKNYSRISLVDQRG